MNPQVFIEHQYPAVQGKLISDAAHYQCEHIYRGTGDKPLVSMSYLKATLLKLSYK